LLRPIELDNDFVLDPALAIGCGVPFGEGLATVIVADELPDVVALPPALMLLLPGLAPPTPASWK